DGSGISINFGRIEDRMGGVVCENFKQVKWSSVLESSKQKDGEAMINSIQNGDQPLPVIAQVSLAGNAQNTPPTLKDPKFWTAKEKRLERLIVLQDLF
nr:hypothetical protein [Tanacetum cinerariifolium]